jgi:hypothetical protein
LKRDGGGRAFRVPSGFPEASKIWADLWARGGTGARSRTQVSQNELELFKCRAQVFDDLGGDHVGVFQVGRVFQAVVLEPEDVEAELVSLRELVIAVRPESALGARFRPGRPWLAAVGGVVAGDELIEFGAIEWPCIQSPEPPGAPSERPVECPAEPFSGPDCAKPPPLEVLVDLGFPVPQGGPRGECEVETQAESEQ